MARERLTWVKFFFTDWAGDLALQSCSLETRGAWLETLCLMWHHGIYSLSGTAADWARRWRCDTSTAERDIDEMEHHRVCEIVRDGETVTLLSRRLEREASARDSNRLRQRKRRCNAVITPQVTPLVTPDVTPHVTDRVLEAQSLRGLEAKKPRGSGVATAAAADVPAERFTIPKPLVEAAAPLGLVSLCGKALKKGHDAQRVLAWVLCASEKPPDNVPAWFVAQVKGGEWPADRYVADALRLLRARDAEIAAERKAVPPSFADALPELERGEGFAQHRNRELNKAKDAAEGRA